MKMQVTILVALLALTTVMINNSQGDQLLPEPICIYCTLLFRSQGCLEKETPLCKLIALKFTINLNNDKLCDKFLCEGGYGQNATTTGTSCKGLLACPVNRLRLNGICSTNKVCCAD